MRKWISKSHVGHISGRKPNEYKYTTIMCKYMEKGSASKQKQVVC